MREKKDKKLFINEVIDDIYADKDLLHHFRILYLVLSLTEDKIEKAEEVKHILTADKLLFYEYMLGQWEEKESDVIVAIDTELKRILKDYLVNMLVLYYDTMEYIAKEDLLNTLTKYFYIIAKYKDTQIADKLREYIKDIIDPSHFIEGLDVENDRSLSTLENYNKYLKLGIAYFNINGLFRDYYAIGKHHDVNIGDRLHRYLREDGVFKLLDKLYFNNDFKQLLKYTKNYLENVRSHSISIKEAEDDLKLYLESVLEIFKEKETLTDEDKKKITEKVETFKEVVGKWTHDDSTKFNFNTLIDLLAFDDKTKEDIIDTKADKKEKEIIEDIKNTFTTKEIIKRGNISQTRNHALTEEVEVSDKWLKVNVSPFSRGINELREVVGTYTEGDEEKLKKLVADLKSKYKKTPSEDLKEEIEHKESLLQEAEERRIALDDKIVAVKEEISTLTRQALEQTEDKDKAQYEKLLKAKGKELKNLEEERYSKGKYLKLDLDNNITAESKGKDVQVFVSLDKYDKTKYSSEGHRLITYAQNYMYYKPDADYIIIEPERYSRENGRKPSTFRQYKKRIEDTLDAIYEESYVFKGKNATNNAEITGKVRLIQEKWELKHDNKTTYAFKPTDAWRKIILNSNNSIQWASVPLLLNQINGQAPSERARALGFYLHEMLRLDLKNQKLASIDKSVCYERTFFMKTLIEALESKGLLSYSKGRYSRDIIKAMQDALNILEDYGLIEYETNAFTIYDDKTNGKKESVLKSKFEEEKIKIRFLVADIETYNTIIKNGRKPRRKKKD